MKRVDFMEEKDKVINIPVEDILPNRFQPRLAFDEKELNELANSILKYGVIQPIVLRRIGDKYEIIAGERRYNATVLAGLNIIPAIMNNTDANTSAETALLENLQRKNLTVIEEAQSFKKLLDRDFTQEEIAAKLGVSQSSIANKLRLLNLPKKVQDALLHNKISERHARSLLSLNDTDKQLELLDRIVTERLTVRQTEEEISKILNKKTDDNDIPLEIKKFIGEELPENKDYLINNIPEVVDIFETEPTEDKPKDQIDTSSTDINPFQTQFEDSIKRINSELNNKDEHYFDTVINSNINIQDTPVEEPKEELIMDEIKDEPKKESLPRIISEIRGFINQMNNNEKITSTELDLPDKYQIIIEIAKDDD